METKILKPSKKNILLAAKCIKSGFLAAFPTETVYGLGASAFNEGAVKKIFEAKGRPSDNPLIVHLADFKQIEDVAFLDPRIEKLKKFMPGALTVVLKKKPAVAPSVTCGLDTVAIRIPANKTALKLIECAGLPIAAPSANSSTKPSPTAARHVYEDLNGKIEYILDGGRCKIGIESTIIDFSGEKIRLLRKGGVSLESLEKELGEIEVLDCAEKPLSPGMKYKHYSPAAAVLLFENGDIDGMIRAYKKALSEKKSAVLITLSEAMGAIKMKSADEYAHRLFYEFRLADAQSIDVIICEKALNQGVGLGLNNRLEKAAGCLKNE